MVSQKAAAISIRSSNKMFLASESVKGDTATINSWAIDTAGSDLKLLLAGEGAFAITALIDPQKLKVSFADFELIENLYSAIFVLSANKDLKVFDIPSLRDFVRDQQGSITVAVNGATSSEAFLASALFASMGTAGRLKLTPYASAAEAAQAVARGETMFAVSHQSQILEASLEGRVEVIAAFDEESLKSGPFAGVQGVGSYGYPYFKNRCFVLAKRGIDAQKKAELKKLYRSILEDEEMISWMRDTMHIEIDPLSEQEAKEHLEMVRQIISRYKDVVM